MLIAYSLSDGTYLIFGGVSKSLRSVADFYKKILTKLQVPCVNILHFR